MIEAQNEPTEPLTDAAPSEPTTPLPQPPTKPKAKGKAKRVEPAPAAPGGERCVIDGREVSWVARIELGARHIMLEAGPDADAQVQAAASARNVSVAGVLMDRIACATATSARGGRPARVTFIARDRLG